MVVNGLLLVTRTRRWPLCVALILATGLLIVACGPLSYTLNPDGGYRVAAASQVPSSPPSRFRAHWRRPSTARSSR